MFNLPEKFSLILRWRSVSYNTKGVCRFQDAYFSGPVLQIASVINPNDSIMVDFYSQYLYLVNNVFIGKLSWGNVVYVDGDNKVCLKDAYLGHSTELNKVPKLGDNDWFLIDTADHVADIHQYNLVYKTYVMKESKDLYRFGSNG